MSDNRMTIPVRMMELPLCLYYETCDEEGMVDPYFTGDITDASGRVMCRVDSEERGLELVTGIDDLLANIAALRARIAEADKELAALKRVALTVVQFWEDAKADYASEDVAMPLGLSVEPVSIEQWADIKGRDLDELARLASGKECAQHTPAAYSPATEEPEPEEEA